MAKFEKRMEAHALRRRGWSIKKVAKYLEVSKSTASIWCRDLELTQKQKERLLQNAIRGGHIGRIRGAEANRRKKQERIAAYQEKGKKVLENLSFKDLLLAGIALYWAEGSKGSKLVFTNSDPQMIKFMMLWFRKIMKTPQEDFMPCIFINEMHRPRIRKVQRFWSDYLDVSIKQFSKPVFLRTKQKKVYENYNSYYGVLALRIRKSVDLKYCILGLIDALKLKYEHEST
ncbi:MAG: helix-turn-helix domain-containing protein [bacterium]|nr:helix-turn-helix domain-containing protein [bacterium]